MEERLVYPEFREKYNIKMMTLASVTVDIVAAAALTNLFALTIDRQVHEYKKVLRTM